MKTWRTNGSDALAVSPRYRLSVGTLRQPRQVWPSSATIASIIFSNCRALLALVRQENHADAILARVRQLKTQTGAGVFEKSVRHLHQDAGAVAGILLAAASAAVIEIFQYRERLLDDFVRFFAFDINDETDAAGIMLEARIVETLFFRPTRLIHRVTLHEITKHSTLKNDAIPIERFALEGFAQTYR